MRSPFVPLAYASPYEIAPHAPMVVVGVMMAVAAAASAAAQMSSARAQSAGLKYNAQIQETNAANARSQADAQADMAGRDAERRAADAKAAFAAGGVDVGQGSPLDVLSDVTKEGELNRQLILYRGKIGADSAAAQAGLDRGMASSALTTGAIGAGSTLLGGLAKGYGTAFGTPSPQGPSTSLMAG
jgi:hypothetical protein